MLDLDYCTIRPTPISTNIPCAFPLPINQVFELSSEVGREYQVRNGLADLAEIFKLPWHRRIVVSTDLATWALAGLLSMIIGIAWDHIGYVVREIAAAVICGLLFLAYKNVAITVKQRIDEPDHRYRN